MGSQPSKAPLSNFNVPADHVGGLLKCDSDSADLGRDRASAVPTHRQVLLMLPGQGPHLEWPGPGQALSFVSRGSPRHPGRAWHKIMGRA